MCLAGIPFHLIQRGHNRSACFLSDHDRLRYLDELRLLARSHGVAVHAYVLMTNHVHLLATPERDGGVSHLMKQFGQRYAQYFNRAHGRVGSLWQGRFHSCMVDGESYLLTCHRYIECNPVRAGMVTHPADYPWSSHRHNALGLADPLVSAHPVFETMAPDEDARRLAYRELFAQPIPGSTLEEIRTMTNSGFALGSPAFKQGIASVLHRRASWIGSGRRTNVTSEKGSDPF
jgi:putative transposase